MMKAAEVVENELKALRDEQIFHDIFIQVEEDVQNFDLNQGIFSTYKLVGFQAHQPLVLGPPVLFSHHTGRPYLPFSPSPMAIVADPQWFKPP
jgi:hypothetical protein